MLFKTSLNWLTPQNMQKAKCKGNYVSKVNLWSKSKSVIDQNQRILHRFSLLGALEKQ